MKYGRIFSFGLHVMPAYMHLDACDAGRRRFEVLSAYIVSSLRKDSVYSQRKNKSGSSNNIFIFETKSS
jgi:hypothetical protein